MFIQTSHSNISFQVVFLVIYNSGMGFYVQANGVSCQLILEKKARHLISTALSLCQFLTHRFGAISTAFIISLLKAQITANMRNLKQIQLDIYQAIVDSGADTNYIKIREMKSISAHQIIQAIYEKSINTILIAFLFWCIVSLICSLVLRIPFLSSFKKNNKSEINV
jgi:secreted Zn-dependent insulinase-like peptidase